jgi:hypothetical protein
MWAWSVKKEPLAEKELQTLGISISGIRPPEEAPGWFVYLDEDGAGYLSLAGFVGGIASGIYLGIKYGNEYENLAMTLFFLGTIAPIVILVLSVMHPRGLFSRAFEAMDDWRYGIQANRLISDSGILNV